MKNCDKILADHRMT